MSYVAFRKTTKVENTVPGAVKSQSEQLKEKLINKQIAQIKHWFPEDTVERFQLIETLRTKGPFLPFDLNRHALFIHYPDPQPDIFGQGAVSAYNIYGEQITLRKEAVSHKISLAEEDEYKYSKMKPNSLGNPKTGALTKDGELFVQSLIKLLASKPMPEVYKAYDVAVAEKKDLNPRQQRLYESILSNFQKLDPEKETYVFRVGSVINVRLNYDLSFGVVKLPNGKFSYTETHNTALNVWTPDPIGISARELSARVREFVSKIPNDSFSRLPI